MSFLVDTDICSAYLKQPGRLAAKFLQYQGRLHVSVVTVAELRTWVLRKQTAVARRQDLNDFLQVGTVLDVTHDMAEHCARIRARQLDAGTPAPRLDLFIAATALVHQLTVVTHNTRHFSAIEGLLVEDWLVN